MQFSEDCRKGEISFAGLVERVDWAGSYRAVSLELAAPPAASAVLAASAAGVAAFPA